jgi:uncharacterized protein YndB with AHSA1/START domain
VTAPDRVRVTTFVGVPPREAFDVFTRDVNAWWRKGPRFRFGKARDGVLAFEGEVGGRLTERFDDGTCFEVGRVLAWEPGARLAFEWRARNFAPDQRTEVEVRFEARDEGTEVVLEHRGWAAIPATHAARHGLEGRAFAEMMGLWWGEIATAFRAHVSVPRDRPLPAPRP